MHGCERLAQHGDAVLHRPAWPLRLVASPGPLDEDVDRHRAVGLDEQDREQAPQPRIAERDRLAIQAGFDVAEQAELHNRQVYCCYRESMTGTAIVGCWRMPVCRRGRGRHAGSIASMAVVVRCGSARLWTTEWAVDNFLSIRGRPRRMAA